MTTRLQTYTSQVMPAPVENWHPSQMQPGVLYLLIPPDDPDDGVAHLLCPCQCGRQIPLMFSEARQVWKPILHDDAPASLTPSINIGDGCRSHFTLTRGQIIWSD